MAMSKALAAPFRKKPSQAKPVSEYASKASPIHKKPRNGASGRLNRKKNGR